MPPRLPDQAPQTAPAEGAAPVAGGASTQPVTLMSSERAAQAPSANPLWQAARAWLVSHLTSPKSLGAIGTAALGILGGSLSIDYLRGWIWPPELGIESTLKPETLEIRAWNTGARAASLRNVVLTVVEDDFTTRWLTEEIAWRDPEAFADDGADLPRDGHDSEFVRIVGKALPSASFFEFGRSCRFHLEATFAREDVRIPRRGDCACDAVCRL